MTGDALSRILSLVETSQQFRSELATDMKSALERHAITFEQDDLTLLRDVDWSKPFSEVEAGVNRRLRHAPIAFWGGESTMSDQWASLVDIQLLPTAHLNALRSWAERAGVALDRERATTHFERLYLFDIVVPDAAGQTASHALVCAWRSYDSAARFASMLDQLELGRVAELKLDYGPLQVLSRVADPSVVYRRRVNYCVAETWALTEAGDSLRFLYNRHNRFSFELQHNRDYVTGMCASLAAQPEMFMEIRGYNDAAGAAASDAIQEVDELDRQAANLAEVRKSSVWSVRSYGA